MSTAAAEVPHWDFFLAHAGADLDEAKALRILLEAGGATVFLDTEELLPGVAGRTAEALALYESTLAARERVLGPDHPDTLQSRNNLAHAYRDLDRTAEAIALFETNLRARERVLGPDHPRTLRSRHNLAASYATTGRTADAAVLFEANLSAQERVLGPDDPETLETRNSLARAHDLQGPRPAGPTAPTD